MAGMYCMFSLYSRELSNVRKFVNFMQITWTTILFVNKPNNLGRSYLPLEEWTPCGSLHNPPKVALRSCFIEDNSGVTANILFEINEALASLWRNWPLHGQRSRLRSLPIAGGKTAGFPVITWHKIFPILHKLCETDTNFPVFSFKATTNVVIKI